jgi:hypothetical protein
MPGRLPRTQETGERDGERHHQEPAHLAPPFHGDRDTLAGIPSRRAPGSRARKMRNLCSPCGESASTDADSSPAGDLSAGSRPARRSVVPCREDHRGPSWTVTAVITVSGIRARGGARPSLRTPAWLSTRWFGARWMVASIPAWRAACPEQRPPAQILRFLPVYPAGRCNPGTPLLAGTGRMPAGLQPSFAQRITLTLPAALRCRVSLPHQQRSFDAGKTTGKASPEVSLARVMGPSCCHEKGTAWRHE